MTLFDKRFVHFMWNDELEGKTGIMSNDIKCLHDYVNNNKTCTELIEHSGDESQPFKTTDGIKFRFAYYDPNYEVKKAFNEGKKIQYKALVTGRWCDFDHKLGPCLWNDTTKYRVKPEEKKRYRPYESPAEMIVDFSDRFKVKCPSYCEPLIWVKGKGTDNRYLVFAFCKNGIEFNDDEPLMFKELFIDYTYLDGSPVGMEVSE